MFLLRIDRVDHQQIFADQVDIGCSAGHGAAVVMLENPAGGEDKGEFRQMGQFWRGLVLKRIKPARPTVETDVVEDDGSYNFV